MQYVWMAVIGFVVGLIARAILPGTQSLGIILTAALGIAGSFLAGFAGKAAGWYAEGEPAGWIASVIGAALLLFIVGKLKGPGAS
ncbi:MAG: GlsB/YeaQ/YmgE family stress response membrane protein [Burkholderiaceae bacterium]